MKTAGKHIVITGGTSGIGLELLRQLQANNEVTIIARPSCKLDKVRNTYDRIRIHEVDLANLKQVEELAAAMASAGRKIDILINNAAVQYTPQFLDDDFQIETIRREIDTNFTSVCILTFHLLPSLLQSAPSIILNVNSGLAIAPKTDSAIYCATKSALNAFSQSLAYQLEGTNVCVKQAFLPLVDTEMTRGRGAGKMPAKEAAAKIVQGLDSPAAVIDIGKVKLLRTVNRLSPGLARKIMKAG